MIGRSNRAYGPPLFFAQAIPFLRSPPGEKGRQMPRLRFAKSMSHGLSLRTFRVVTIDRPFRWSRMGSAIVACHRGLADRMPLSGGKKLALGDHRPPLE
jgi:hypothetical protein